MVVCVQVVEDGYEFFAKRQLVTLFSAPNYCGEFDNAGAMMSVDETLMCSFQVSQRRRIAIPILETSEMRFLSTDAALFSDSATDCRRHRQFRCQCVM